jgi:hypothetical protein
MPCLLKGALLPTYAQARIAGRNLSSPFTT